MTQDYNPNLEVDLSNTAATALLQTVEVQTERLAERYRRISARIHIPHAIEQVWQVLTDYETLADFIPNLARSQRLEHPKGGIRLEQVGTQRLLNFNFSARVILDLEEKFPQKIDFQMIEGDFKDFSGSWCLEPCFLAERAGTNLEYIVCVLPKRTMPVSIIERRLSKDMQTNLVAIRQRVTEVFS
ncbi:SRPBCC family protein [Gloeocapsa sp. BRSZ]|uniref:SRPBCC family protein n=1 Tax=Gloeocapsa sp. PCC 7428 TaxID=1173026 RepID=UPI0002A5E3F4|nr:SRPBCC family protein [Gloeocapsa sp. PCC 7428]AFZ31886.1 cyclase/dehydrase [Gloeocapsa sp. PCC 7428]